MKIACRKLRRRSIESMSAPCNSREWLLKHGRDQEFAARRVLGRIPVVNLRALSARGILEKAGSAREAIAHIIA
jgi:hypothetical protein